MLPLTLALPGPVGETNTLRFAPRGCVLGLGADRATLCEQFAAALATGNRFATPDSAEARLVHDALPAKLSERYELEYDWRAATFDAVLVADETGAVAVRALLAARPGPIIPLVVADHGYDVNRLLCERTVTVNVTAAGGNAHLMTIGKG